MEHQVSESEEQLEQNETLLLPTGSFQDREELLNVVREFTLRQGYAISIKQSRKDDYVLLGCDRGGVYRNRYNVVDDHRKRKAATRLVNCPFQLRGKRKVDGSWVLEVRNGFHNHEPSDDMSGRPFYRRFSEDEILRIKHMIKAGLPTRQILSSLRLTNPNLKAIAKTVNNMKARVRKDYLDGRTTVQALLEELGDGGFMHNYVQDSDGHLIRLFFAHPLSVALTKSYSNVFVMDCTYKTDKYKMPLLEIVGVSSFNTSFCSCFIFLQKEEEEDSIWALRMFSKILGDGCEPSTIVTDRELALMKAIQVIFPKTANILCIWHIEKNILTHCKPHFRERELLPEFLSSWTVILNSSSESDYEEPWRRFEEQYKDKSVVANYIKSTWLPLKEHFIGAWIEKYTHFGTRVSSRAKGAHEMLKAYLHVSTGNLCEVKNKICLAIENQFQAIKTQFYSEKVRIPHHLHIHLFKELLTHVSVFALNKLFKQYELLRYGDDLAFACKSQFSTTMGLPCAHKIRNLINGTISLDEIHAQWRLDGKSFVDSSRTSSLDETNFKELLGALEGKYQEWPIDKREVARNHVALLVNEPTPLIYESNLRPYRGRPLLPKRKNEGNSTRRDPSAHEIVEKGRKCSTCKEVGHKSRTCRNNGVFEHGSSSRTTALDCLFDTVDLDAMEFSINDLLRN